MTPKDNKIVLIFTKSKVEGFKTFFEKANEVITWLVGFAITASFVLAFEKKEFPVYFLIAKVLLLATTLFGISYKVGFSFFSMLLKKGEIWMPYIEEKIQDLTDLSEEEKVILNYLWSNDLFRVSIQLMEKEVVDIDFKNSVDWINIGNTDEKLILQSLLRLEIFEIIKKLPENKKADLFSTTFSEYKELGNLYNRQFDAARYVRSMRKKINFSIYFVMLSGLTSLISFVIVLVMAVF